MFSALNRQKNKNIRPRPEKQHSYKKERVCIKKKSTVNVCSYTDCHSLCMSAVHLKPVPVQISYVARV